MDKVKRQTLVRAGYLGIATMAGIAYSRAGYTNATRADLNHDHTADADTFSLS